MNANKALWEKGDFTRIAESMRDSGEALVDGLGITRGLDVLTSDAATARPPCRRRAAARTSSASTSPPTSWRPATSGHGPRA